MATFSERDVRVAFTKLFDLARADRREGGVPDTADSHLRVMNVAALTFLLNPKGVFHVGRLAVNRLLTLVNYEVGLVEDILFVLEKMSAVTDTTSDSASLSNAYTSLLALESADAISADRPEFGIFSKNINKFINSLGPALRDPYGNSVMTSEDAKRALLLDLQALKRLHPLVLEAIEYLRSLLEDFNTLNLKGVVASVAFPNVRSSLQDMRDLVNSRDQQQIAEKSKSMLIDSTAAKNAVAAVAESEAPDPVKSDSQGNGGAGTGATDADGNPVDGPITGQAAGEGTAAAFLTSPGPWKLPLIAMELETESGTETVPLDDVERATLRGTVEGPYNVNAAPNRYLTVTVDPSTHELKVTGLGGADEDDPSWVQVQLTEDPDTKIGFKHLGTPVVFGGFSQNPGTPQQPASDDKKNPVNPAFNPLTMDPLTGLDAEGDPLLNPNYDPLAFIEEAINPNPVSHLIKMIVKTVLALPPAFPILQPDPINPGLPPIIPYKNFPQLVPPVTLPDDLETLFGGPMWMFFESGNLPGAPIFKDREYQGPIYKTDYNDTNPLAPPYPAPYADVPQIGDTRPFLDNSKPRIIQEIRPISAPPTFTVNTWNSSSKVMTVSGFASFDPSKHVGGYIKLGSARYEILQVLSPNAIVIDNRDGLISGGASGEIYQAWGTAGTDFVVIVSPDINIPDGRWRNAAGDPGFTPEPGEYWIPPVWMGTLATVLPAAKTTQLDSGSALFLSDVILDINGNTGPDSNVYRSVGAHVRAKTSAENPNLLSLVARSENGSYARVDSTFYYVNEVGTGPGPYDYTNPSNTYPKLDDPETWDSSVHDVIGLTLGEESSDEWLRADYLVEIINGRNPLIAAEALLEEPHTGTTLRTLIATGTVQDDEVDFLELGIQAGHQLVIDSGKGSGRYTVLTATAHQLTLDGALFVADEKNLKYSILEDRVKISSASDQPGSSIKVNSSPAIFDAPADEQYGEHQKMAAVDKDGNPVQLPDVAAGDVLQVDDPVGGGGGDSTTGEPGDGSTEVGVVGVDADGNLILDGPIPSNYLDVRFRIIDPEARSYRRLKTALDEYVTQRSLLPKNGFDEDLEALDNALSSVVAVGSQIGPTKNRAITVATDLLEVRTNQPRRSGEYTTKRSGSRPAVNLETVLQGYSANYIEAIKALIVGLRERKFDRAADLLTQARVLDFFQTNDYTASYSGQLMQAIRVSAADLPEPRRSAEEVDDETALEVELSLIDDPDEILEETEELS